MKFSTQTVWAIGLISGVVAVALFFAPVKKTRAQGPEMRAVGQPSTTPWRPKGQNLNYVGPEACARCHKEESATQHTTSMGRALEPVETSDVLGNHKLLTFNSGPYSYKIARQGNQSIYTVTDGANTLTQPILYAFGQGKAGQTYLFRSGSTFYEARVSYYRDTQGLDWTMGYPSSVPPNLEVAAGRALGADEVHDCFACHSTGGTNGTTTNLEKIIPGVTCEACHGPGGDHIAAMDAKNFKEKKIFNPGKMSPDEQVQEFCGSCHRSAEQVASNQGLHGIRSVRFQPYRLFTSKGHDPFDPRLTCVACHNPHEAPHTDVVYYDAKCLACHLANNDPKTPQKVKADTDNGRTASACPVANKDCTTCHMPKVALPGSHFLFTDHRIRIAKPGDPFPG